MNVILFKLNGWPDAYDERIKALAESTNVALIRSAPVDSVDEFDCSTNISIYNVYPRRGSYVTPSWLKPFVFIIHVIQAILLALILTVVQHQRPDVVHALDYVLGGVAAMCTSLILRRPFIVSVRGYKEPIYRSILEQNKTLKNKVNYMILIFLSKLVLERADYVITKAEYQRDAVNRVVSSSPGFETVPTGVDLDRFNPQTINKDDYITELFDDKDEILTGNSFRLLYFGQLVPQKGVDLILKHIRDTSLELPEELVIVIVGEFRTDEFQREIIELSEEISYPVLIQSSRIPFKDIPRLLSSVDMVTLLSEPLHEGVPRALQEAGVMEVPIVAADVRGISGAFSDLPGCKLVDRNEPNEYVQAISGIHQESPKMDREKYASEFDMYENYRSYVKVYEECIEKDSIITYP